MVTDLPFSPWLAIEFQVQRGSWFIELPTSPACLLSCLDYLSIVRLFSSVQSLSPVSLFATPWTATCQASLSIQTYVHWVGDAIQPSHPLLSPSPPAFNLPQHQGLFKRVSSSNQVAKVLEFQLQHQPFQWIFRTGVLWDGLVGSPCSPRDSQESSTPQFKSINFSALSFPHSPTLTSIHDYWKIHSLD